MPVGINVTTPLVRDFTTFIVTADQRVNPRHKLDRPRNNGVSRFVRARPLYSQLNPCMLDCKERFRRVACWLSVRVPIVFRAATFALRNANRPAIQSRTRRGKFRIRPRFSPVLLRITASDIYSHPYFPAAAVYLFVCDQSPRAAVLEFEANSPLYLSLDILHLGTWKQNWDWFFWCVLDLCNNSQSAC